MAFSLRFDRSRKLRGPVTEIGVVIRLAGFFLSVIGRTIIDPYGDGLRYGVTSLVGGLLIGYGHANSAPGSVSGKN